MRWQLVDRIETFEPWARIDGRKTISLEESLLQEPFGLRGEAPSALVVGGLVQLVRLLVAASSNFETGGRLVSLSELTLSTPPGRGASFALSARVSPPSMAGDVAATVRAEVRGEVACTGALVLGLLPLGDLEDPEEAKAHWEALFRPQPRR